MQGDTKLLQKLIDKGVVVHAPHATLVEDLDPDRIEAGVEIFPACTIRGERTLIGRGSRIGMAGGGYFENLAAGRGVQLFGGFFQDCALLDGVKIRGHAELRAGTLLEEACSAAQHVGLKMTVWLPFVTAGSLVNFADALVAGGSGSRDFSEIGSLLALYNYSPQDDKWPARFGDVPRGVFCRSARIFIGGQARIVSPVKVGYGAVIAAGGAVRKDVPEGRLYAEADPRLDRDFDPRAYGPLKRKLLLTAEHVGNLHALLSWYRQVRWVSSAGDSFRGALLAAAMAQIEAGIEERLQRLDALAKKLPASGVLHHEALAAADDDRSRAWLSARLAEHAAIETGWPRSRDALSSRRETKSSALAPIAAGLSLPGKPDRSFPRALQTLLPEQVEAGRRDLQAIVDARVAESGIGALPEA